MFINTNGNLISKNREMDVKQAAHVDIESFIDQVTSVSGQVICLRTATSSTLGSKNCDEIGAHLQKV